TSTVVPAKAGTHTPRIFNWNETLQQSFVSREHGGYGSPPSRGRRLIIFATPDRNTRSHLSRRARPASPRAAAKRLDRPRRKYETRHSRHRDRRRRASRRAIAYRIFGPRNLPAIFSDRRSRCRPRIRRQSSLPPIAGSAGPITGIPA